MATWDGENTSGIHQRRERRGMGVLPAVSDIDERRGAAEGVWFEGGVQRSAVVCAGCPWRMLPNDVAPWWAVQQQTQRWIQAGCFEAMAHDLRLLLRVALERRNLTPTVGLLDSRTLQSTPESGARAGYDGANRRKGSKVHAAVDTLGHLLALKVTSAAEQDRAQVGEVVASAQAAAGSTLERVYVDQPITRSSIDMERMQVAGEFGLWAI